MLRKQGLVHSQVGTSIPRHHPGPFSGFSMDAGCPHPCGSSVVLCEEDICLLRTRGMLYLSAFPSQSGTRSKPLIKLLLTPGSAVCPVSVLVPAGRGRLHGGVTALRHSMCPATFVWFHWVAQSYFFNSITIYQKYLSTPVPASASWDQEQAVSCWSARAAAALPLASPAECNTSASGGIIVGCCDRNG